MKRTFRHPDGTEETLEGTAEELAEYEKKLKREQQEKRPDVLKGAPDVVYVPYIVGPLQVQPYPQPCWVCGQYNCHQTHIWCGTLDGTGLTKFIEDHPERDWTHLALNAGGNKITLS
ncbi:MAG: hypothetical protein JO112_20035 [Planctomycetes bacterium]|nr:hypothetical protein [Planctomycetota bacterium]